MAEVELRGVARWATSDEKGNELAAVDAPGGEVDVSDPRVHEALTAAQAAGVLTFTGGGVSGVVQSDAASEKIAAKAEKARAPLFEQRDRELRGARRLPEVLKRSREEVEREAADGSALHRALLAGAGDDVEEFDVPVRTEDDLRELADNGSTYHELVLVWNERIERAAQEAVE